ncbi:unnamed protein product [marine sediment metagenome]|uniref:Uncharacterized protein n=1 Tax=marine sediment metagenome TaxID=412755 RepID=X1L2X3_9ZZZZ
MKGAVVTKEVRERSRCIAVRQQTKDALDLIKHPGQSYDGVIQDLLEFWKQKKREYWTWRKEQKVPVG